MNDDPKPLLVFQGKVLKQNYGFIFVVSGTHQYGPAYHKGADLEKIIKNFNQIPQNVL